DEDGDGVRDAGEDGIAEVALTVDGEAVRTGADGRYALQVAAGRHAVEVLASNADAGGPLGTARPTTGGRSRTVTVGDDNALDSDFGELFDHAPSCSAVRADMPVLWPPD